MKTTVQFLLSVSMFAAGYIFLLSVAGPLASMVV